MEVKILEEDKKRIKLELKGVDEGFYNLLKKELWNNKSISIAGVNVEHPLIDKTLFVVETDGKLSPKKALLDAAKNLTTLNDKFKKDFVKAIK